MLTLCKKRVPRIFSVPLQPIPKTVIMSKKKENVCYQKTFNKSISRNNKTGVEREKEVI